MNPTPTSTGAQWNNPQWVSQKRAIAIQAGYKPADVDSFIATQKKQQATLSLIKSGVVDVKDIAADDPITAQKAIADGAKPKTDNGVNNITAQQAGLAKAGLTNIQEVKKQYLNDPDVLKKQLIPGQFLTRKWDSALYDTADALLRLRTGAQANPSEIRGYMNKIAPSFGDDPETVAYKLQKLENDFKIASGEKPDAKTIDVSKLSKKQQVRPQPQAPQQSSGNQVIDLLGQIGQRQVQGLQQAPLVPGAPLNLQQVLAAIQSVPGRAVDQRTNSVIDTVQAGQRPSLDQVAGMGGELALGASLPVDGGIIPAAATAGAGGGIYGATTPGASVQERAKNAGIQGLLAAATVGATGAVGKGAGRGKAIFTGQAKKVAAETRNAIAEQTAKQLPTDALKTEAERISKNLPATATKAKQEVSNLQKSINAKDLVEKIDYWGQAYKDSGEIKDTATAKLYGSLQRTAKKILADEAPDVAKAHEKLRSEAALHSLPNRTGRAIFKYGTPASILLGLLAAGKAVGSSR